MSKPCIICDNALNNTTYTVKELQLGLRHEFKYQQCGNCKSLQIVDIPENLGEYYSNEKYYSFNAELKEVDAVSSIKKIRTDYILHNKHSLLGKILTLGYTPSETYQWLKNTNANYDDAILDVGTGNGSLLTKFAELGFTNLTGIDPFIDSSYKNGHIEVLKKDILEVDTKFDIIMMHHSLEHVLNPLEVLKHIYKILKPNGRVLIRIPIMNNYGWHRYGVYWCGIDAPRHILIPSVEGFKKLASDAGFEITNFYFDSYDYVIWCSEQYQKGIALDDENSQKTNPEESIFKKEEIKAMRKLMIGENSKNNGDMAAFYLTPKKDSPKN